MNRHLVGIDYVIRAVTTSGDAALRKDKQIRASALETQAVTQRSEKMTQRESAKTTVVLEAQAEAWEEVGDEALKSAAKSQVADKAMASTGRGVEQLTRRLGGGGGGRGGGGLRQAIFDSNQSFSFFRNTISLIKWPAIVSAVGFVVQAVSALASGLVALTTSLASASGALISLTSALAPAAGALIAYPALIGAIGQAMATVTLAFGGLKEAMQEQQTGISAVAQASLGAQGAALSYKDALRAQEQALIASGAGSLQYKQATLAVAQAQQQATMAEKELANARRAGNAEIRAFAKFIEDEAKPKLIELQGIAAKGLLPGLAGAGRQLLNGPLFDAIRQGIGNQASALGSAAQAGASQLNKPGFVKDIQQVFKNNTQLTRDFSAAILGLTKTVVNLLVAATPLIRWFGQLARRFGEWAEASTKAARETGKLQAFFVRSMNTLRTLGRIVGNVGKALINTFSAGRKQGETMLDSIEKITRKWADWTESVTGRNRLDRFFERSGRSAATWGRMIKDFLVGILNVFKGSSRAGRILSKDLADAATRFRKFTETTRGQNRIREFFDASIVPLRAMGRLVEALGGAFIRLGQSEGVAKLADILTVRLVPALENLVVETNKAFGPALANSLASIVELFAQLAGATGPLTTFVKVIGQMADALNDLINTVPALKTAMFNLIGALAIFRAVKGVGAVGGKLLGAGLIGSALGIGGRGGKGAGAGAGAAAPALIPIGALPFGAPLGQREPPVPPTMRGGIAGRLQGLGQRFGKVGQMRGIGPAGLAAGVGGLAVASFAPQGSAIGQVGSGVAQGAAIGALAGSAIPGVGTGLGALAGAAIGAGFALRGLSKSADKAAQAQEDQAAGLAGRIRQQQQTRSGLRSDLGDAILGRQAARQQLTLARANRARAAGGTAFERQAAGLDVRIAEEGFKKASTLVKQIRAEVGKLNKDLEKKTTTGITSTFRGLVKETEKLRPAWIEAADGSRQWTHTTTVGLEDVLEKVNRVEAKAGKNAPAQFRRMAQAVREVAQEAQRMGVSLTNKQFNVKVTALLNDADFQRRMRALLKPRSLQVRIETLSNQIKTGPSDVHDRQELGDLLVQQGKSKAAAAFDRALTAAKNVFLKKQQTPGESDDIQALSNLINMLNKRASQVSGQARTELLQQAAGYAQDRKYLLETMATADKEQAQAFAQASSDAKAEAQAAATAAAIAKPVFKKGQLAKMTFEQLGNAAERLQKKINEARQGGIDGSERINVARWRRALSLVTERINKFISRQIKMLENLAQAAQREIGRVERYFAQLGISGPGVEGIVAGINQRTAQTQIRRITRLLKNPRLGADQKRGLQDQLDAARTAAADAKAQQQLAQKTRVQEMQNLQMRHIEAQQRIAGTFDTAGGRAQRSAALMAQIGPLQKEIKNMEAARRKAEEAGSKKRAAAIADAIYAKNVEIEEKKAEALELIRQNTEETAKNTGPLSFEFQGQRMTDAYAMGMGV